VAINVAPYARGVDKYLNSENKATTREHDVNAYARHGVMNVIDEHIARGVA